MDCCSNSKGPKWPKKKKNLPENIAEKNTSQQGPHLGVTVCTRQVGILQGRERGGNHDVLTLSGVALVSQSAEERSTHLSGLWAPAGPWEAESTPTAVSTFLFTFSVHTWRESSSRLFFFFFFTSLFLFMFHNNASWWLTVNSLFCDAKPGGSHDASLSSSLTVLNHSMSSLDYKFLEVKDCVYFISNMNVVFKMNISTNKLSWWDLLWVYKDKPVLWGLNQNTAR